MTGDAESIAAAAREAARQQYTESSLRAVREAVEGLTSRVAALQEESVEATDASGTVTARVNGDGEVADIYISPYAMRDLDADQLGEACLRAVREAQSRLGVLLTERIREITGNDDIDRQADPRAALDEFVRRTREARR
ncbi:YbaB/EbfC family nucleoid-associated protein [Micromonospora purpureochromogenes]|uniref:DNA-binding protein YbaB n=1 Tax=Micromonospora purpureochromogenes TaxID=47872 RepID=A0ABX2RDV1_9ACTN|nr:YbaB/EbfC family nucleoid-associated protein [Micromonospora purpureochromogenes]NYF54456.1 DNA-binding protein YbaB [Micromonospora purpureochromogenes]